MEMGKMGIILKQDLLSVLLTPFRNVEALKH
jgi:hypothetical protein